MKGAESNHVQDVPEPESRIRGLHHGQMQAKCAGLGPRDYEDETQIRVQFYHCPRVPILVIQIDRGHINFQE